MITKVWREEEVNFHRQIVAGSIEHMGEMNGRPEKQSQTTILGKCGEDNGIGRRKTRRNERGKVNFLILVPHTEAAALTDPPRI